MLKLKWNLSLAINHATQEPLPLIFMNFMKQRYLNIYHASALRCFASVIAFFRNTFTVVQRNKQIAGLNTFLIPGLIQGFIANLSPTQPANLQVSCGEPTYMWLQPRHVYM